MAYKNPNKNKEKYPWMGQRFIRGRKERKCFVSKKEALLWEMETISEPGRQETLTISLIDWATEYLSYSEKKFVKNTFEEKRFAFKQLFSHPGISPQEDVKTLSSIQVQKALQHQAKIRSGNSANKDRKNLSAAWSWGIKFLNFPESNPFSKVEKFSSKRHNRYIPTLDDFWKVYDVAETDQDQLMLFCYLQTGARRDELFRLKWSDVDFFGKRIRLSWRKNKAGEWNNQWICVKDELVKWLMKYRSEEKDNSFVFLSNKSNHYLFRQHWLPTLCKKAGVHPFGFHGIRHLFASILASQNVPLVEIQYMLRHNNLTTTQKYIHRLQKENREVLAALPDLKDSGKVHQKYIHKVSGL